MSLLSLNSSKDLLYKCKLEIDELIQCESHPKYDFILFNIVLGLNHLFEWFLKEKEIKLKKRLDCINIFNPFISPYDVSHDFKEMYRKLDDFPETNKYQKVIRKLCNKAKHFKTKTEIESRYINCTACAGNMGSGELGAVSGAFDHYIYFVDIDGVETDLEELLQSQIQDWSNFIENQ